MPPWMVNGRWCIIPTTFLLFFPVALVFLAVWVWICDGTGLGMRTVTNSNTAGIGQKLEWRVNRKKRKGSGPSGRSSPAELAPERTCNCRYSDWEWSIGAGIEDIHKFWTESIKPPLMEVKDAAVHSYESLPPPPPGLEVPANYGKQVLSNGLEWAKWGVGSASSATLNWFEVDVLKTDLMWSWECYWGCYNKKVVKWRGSEADRGSMVVRKNGRSSGSRSSSSGSSNNGDTVTSEASSEIYDAVTSSIWSSLRSARGFFERKPASEFESQSQYDDGTVPIRFAKDEKGETHERDKSDENVEKPAVTKNTNVIERSTGASRTILFLQFVAMCIGWNRLYDMVRLE
jgi:hypothetical protein